MNLSDKILNVAAELGPEKKKLEDLTAKLTELTQEAAECEEVEKEEALMAQADEIGAEVEKLTPVVGKLEKRLEELRKAEKRLASGSQPASGPGIVKGPNIHHKPGDSLMRIGVVKALSYINRRSEREVAEELYGDDDNFKMVFGTVDKTAAPIATTTNPGYAAELVQTEVRGLLESVESQSVAAALALAAGRSGGMLLNFGGNQSLTVPRLNPTGATPTEPAWVN